MQDERQAQETNPQMQTEDARQPYVAPVLETLDGQLSALLGSQCGGPGSGTHE